MRWVLHIGTQKTGSKALQHVLSHELDRVAGARVYYPAAGREGIWHEPVYYALEAGNSSLLKAARDEARGARADYAILSCEGFYELPPAAIARIREVIGEATVVLLLRRQDSLLNSWYNQLIKAHKVAIDEIRDFERRLTDYHPASDHFATLQKWAAVFGWECQRPIIYRKSTCVVDEFFGELGLRIDRTDLKLPNPNKALDARAASLVRGVKELIGTGPELPQLIQMLHEQFGANFVDTFESEECYLFDMAARQKILNLYTESNERVRCRFFPERDSLFDALEARGFHPLNIDEGRTAARAFLKASRSTT